MAAIQPGSMPAQELVNGFRTRFHQYVARVQAAVTQNTDTTVLERIKSDLDQFIHLTIEVLAGCNPSVPFCALICVMI